MSFVRLAEVWRGPVVESVHHGVAVVADDAGRIVRAWGDPGFVTFPRSSLKPFQAIGLVASGAAEALGLSEEHLALACASHHGEEFQVALVRDWLRRLELPESALVCGPDLPRGAEEQAAWLRGGGGRSRVFHNCSGKHCGFLSVARRLGAPVAGYEDPAHPAQLLYMQAFSELLGRDAAGLARGVDGCGLPAFALSVGDMARAAARHAAVAVAGEPRRAAIRRIHAAMRAHPDHLSGRDQPTSRLMRAAEGRVLVKGGAEGFVVAFVPERGLGIAVKIADGAGRAKMGVLAVVLGRVGVLDPATVEAVVRAVEPPVRDSNGREVGRIAITLPG